MKKTSIFVIVSFLMKKPKYLLLFICILLLFSSCKIFSKTNGVLFAEEPLAYKVTEESEAYKKTENGGYDIIFLNKGKIVHSNNNAYSNFIKDTWDYVFMMFLTKPYDWYGIHVKNLSPVNTEDVFGKEIFIDYPPDIAGDRLYFLERGDVKEMWVPSYYCNVLKSKNRKTLLKFNSTVVILDNPLGRLDWYDDDRSGIRNGRCMFYNAAIMIGDDTHFLVRNIKKTEYGYAVNCVESASDYRDKEEKYTTTYYQPFQDTSEFWNKYNPGDEMTLYLYLDGDYMDIYVDSKDLHLGTIVKVKKEFIEEYQSLIRKNKCDLSRITSWPRRADGSMD